MASRVLVALRVAATPERAFEAFTREIGQWWQPDQLFQFTDRSATGRLAFEPGPGGRLVERQPNGDVFEIGPVTAWDPPVHLAFEWRQASFARDQSTEVHVTFEPAGAETRVTVEHYGWDALPQEHAARHGFPLEFTQLRLAEWWRALLNAYAGAALASANQMDTERSHSSTVGPDSTAVRVALWRAMHVLVDQPPHVFEDEIGLKLAAPDTGWRERPDMDPRGTSIFRAAIVARARFIEDLAVEAASRGVSQYVLLGAGLDTFAQRRPEVASRMRVFEVDQPGHQAWKRQRLIELGFGIPEWLRLVPVDFEAGEDWWRRLAAAGFDAAKPALVASSGVSMYLTRDSIAAMLRRVASLAPGSTLAMTFLLPLELADPAVQPWLRRAEEGARASGTPFISYFTPSEILAMAREAGFKQAEHVSADMLSDRYFANRTDGLRPPSNSEELLVART